MEQLGQFIINHWALWSALIIILILIFINEWMSQKSRAKELTPAGAVHLMNHQDATVIDTRDAEAFKSGHIINATRANSEDFDKERFKKLKQKPIILVCARGLQSSALATKLREKGYEQVTVLSGGMAAWEAANLPVVKGK
ncbi:rhodanese-like domain-containing protein [Legionella impletisoli]|uniref:Sulfurtransferase n=1 Tax=Legionella impletisoli TaxID=343510 RepID=A0A917JXM8_9GAMM|nr:rhodanese-like domain-containing protein [Legionella impletisoli]GGI89316.1 sulfurtransferase [Legionella impletisoli]